MSYPTGVSRRRFLNVGVSAGSAAILGASGLRAAESSAAVPAAGKTEVRVAMIGTGGRGTGILEALHKVAGVRVTALCDIDRKRMEEAAALVGDDKPVLLDDYRRLLECKELDAVCVETPAYLHAEMGIAVLESGRHLYAEKPMGITVAEVNGVHAAAKTAKAIYQGGTQLRYSDPWQTCIRAIHDGIIGEVVLIRAHRHNYIDLPHERLWYHKRALSGDTIVEQAVHEFDLMNQVFDGIPVKAAGFGGQAVMFEPEGRDIRDHYGLLLDYGRNRKVSYSHSWIAPPHVPCDGRRELIYGAKGALDLETGQLFLHDADKPGMVEHKKTKDHTLGAVEDFVRCIREGKQPFASADAARNACLVGLLGRKALDEEQVVTMDALLASG